MKIIGRQAWFRIPYAFLPHWKRVLVPSVALCTLLLAEPVFAQQSAEAPSEINRQDDIAVATTTDHTTESSQRQIQAPAAAPDAPSASRGASANVNSLTLHERFRIYGHSIIRPYSVIGPALGAGIGQWEDEPPEWGQGAKGYARRFGSGMGRHLIAETIRFGVAAADSEDPRYHPSQESGVWKRARHAILETFTSQTTGGSRVPAYSRFVGIYGAAFIANSWYPDSRATPGYALRRGSTALGSSVGFNLFREFLPRRKLKALHSPRLKEDHAEIQNVEWSAGSRERLRAANGPLK